MKINLITPAKKHSKNGNRTSALRWAGFLRDQGHNVDINTEYDGLNCDMMIALHAWRSAEAISQYRSKYPNGPLIVALGGTDVNTFLESEKEVTLSSMEKADALVCLHARIGEALPPHLLNKLHVIYQSAEPLILERKFDDLFFDICVIGHLRDEKDPLRTAFAARLLPASSNIRVTHLGKAHNEDWHKAALKEQKENPRYHWQGEVPAVEVRKELSRARLMVLTSNQEGGANVISEAIIAGVPVLASDIPGNTGLLGKDYPGLFPLGDETALADKLSEIENNPHDLAQLETACQELRPRFSPKQESTAWNELVRSFSK